MGKKKTSLSSRYYWISLVTYATPNEFKPLLDKCRDWAFAYHDKDTNENGTPKEPHYHILVHFDNARSINACRRDIHSTQNVLGESVISPIGAYQYLWHENDIDKYQYERSIVVCSNPVYWEHFLPNIRDRDNADFIEDLLSDDVSTKMLAMRYGRDFMKNMDAYYKFVERVKLEESYLG